MYTVSMNCDGSMYYMNPVNTDLDGTFFIKSRIPVNMTHEMAELAARDAFVLLKLQYAFCGIQENPHDNIFVCQVS